MQQLPGLVRHGSRNALRRLRLGLVDSFASTMGADLIKALQSSANQVMVWSGLTPFLYDSLVLRQIDMAITADAMNDRDDFEVLTLFQEPYVLVQPCQDGKAACVDMVRLAASLPLIRYSSRSSIGKQVDRQLRRLGIDAPRRFEFDATDPLLNMVVAGLGWSITTPLCLLQARYPPGSFHVAPLPGPGMSRSILLMAWRNELGTLPATTAVLVQELLRKHYFRQVLTIAPWLTLGDFLPEDSRRRDSSVSKALR
ncbi:MAG: LysR family transcriptional regulator substrate-binding protein [Ideonella sp.]